MDPTGGMVIDLVIPAPAVAGGIVLWPEKAPGPAPRAPEDGSDERGGMARAPDMGGVFDDRFDGYPALCEPGKTKSMSFHVYSKLLL